MELVLVACVYTFTLTSFEEVLLLVLVLTGAYTPLLFLETKGKAYVSKKNNDESGVSWQQVFPVVSFGTQDHRLSEEWGCGRRFQKISERTWDKIL